jgi:hypothetical protein
VISLSIKFEFSDLRLFPLYEISLACSLKKHFYATCGKISSTDYDSQNGERRIEELIFLIFEASSGRDHTHPHIFGQGKDNPIHWHKKLNFIPPTNPSDIQQ